ncbi:DUF6286 domain-containing protein [Pseudonocardia sp. TRM90224]|uniref:DUF6286 domain-containing protein n=1 Tax=Pseudonocardia sp. TRM90224 TaxID=2812678 RepID=UPI001E658CC4|nr:DUF6286 domain-containing protein [Pseudonocardia sp. TRM90224]
MRVLLRVLAPLLGLALAAAGVLFVIEVVAAWVRPVATAGLVVPWPQWRTTLEQLSWDENPVPGIAIAVAVLGLLLVLVGLLARRSNIQLDAPNPELAVRTSPRVLARLVGTRVRAGEDVAAATVTASARKVSVAAQSWNGGADGLRSSIHDTVEALLDELPLHRRPRVSVTVRDREGVR